MSSTAYGTSTNRTNAPAFRAVVALPVQASVNTVWDVITRPDVHYCEWDKNVRSATLDTPVMRLGTALTVDFAVLPVPIVQNITSFQEKRKIVFDSLLHGPIDEEGKHYGEIEDGLLRFHFTLSEDPGGAVIERGVMIWGPRQFAAEFGAYQAESLVTDTRSLVRHLESTSIK